jgi:hypothetical protein
MHSSSACLDDPTLKLCSWIYKVIKFEREYPPYKKLAEEMKIHLVKPSYIEKKLCYNQTRTWLSEPKALRLTTLKCMNETTAIEIVDSVQYPGNIYMRVTILAMNPSNRICTFS